MVLIQRALTVLLFFRVSQARFTGLHGSYTESRYNFSKLCICFHKCDQDANFPIPEIAILRL